MRSKKEDEDVEQRLQSEDVGWSIWMIGRGGRKCEVNILMNATDDERIR